MELKFNKVFVSPKMGSLRRLEDSLLNACALGEEEGLLLERIEEAREELISRKARLMQGTSLTSQVRRFQLLGDSLTPEELKKELDDLKSRAGWECAHLLQKKLDQWAFEEENPAVKELKTDSIHSTFATRLLAIARLLDSAKQVQLFQDGLNERQKQEVLRRSGAYPSPEGLGHAIRQYVQDLQMMARWAKERPEKKEEILQLLQECMGLFE